MLQPGIPNPLQYYQSNSPCRFNPYFGPGPAPPLVPLTNSLASLENIGVSHQNTSSTNHQTNTLPQNNPHLSSLLPSHHNNPIPAHHNHSPLPAHINTSHPAHHSHPSALPAHLGSSSLLQAHHNNIPAAHLNNTPAHLNSSVISSRSSTLPPHPSLTSHFNSPPAHLNTSVHSSNSSSLHNNFTNSVYSLHNAHGLQSHLTNSQQNSHNNSGLNSPHNSTGLPSPHNSTGQPSPRSNSDLSTPHNLVNIQSAHGNLSRQPHSNANLDNNLRHHNTFDQTKVQPSTSANLNKKLPIPFSPEKKPPQNIVEEEKPPPKSRILTLLERAKRPPKKVLDAEALSQRQQKLSAKLHSLIRHKILELVNSRCKLRETVDSSEVFFNLM